EAGNLLGFVKMTHDDTERRKSEQERLQLVREQEARVQAEQAVAARDEFLAVLSHELRNPLGAISNALSVIQKVKSNTDVPSRAQAVVARQTFNLTRLVNDLLDLSRVTSGKIKLERRPTDVRQTIDKSMQALTAAAVARDSHIELSAPPDPILVDADPVRF